MMVEFMGCSGAGKSSLSSRLVQRLEQEGCPVRFHDSRGSSTVTSLANAVCTPLSLVPLLLNGCSRRFLWVAVRLMLRRQPKALWLVIRTWSMIRILGVNVVRARWSGNAVCVADEGVLGLAHQIFDGDTCATPDEIESFGEAIPLPDVVVWVDASTSALLERTLARTDRPREWRHHTPAQLHLSIQRVSDAFQAFSLSDRLAGRLIHVSNTAAQSDECGALVEQVLCELKPRIAPWPA